MTSADVDESPITIVSMKTKRFTMVEGEEFVGFFVCLFVFSLFQSQSCEMCRARWYEPHCSTTKPATLFYIGRGASRIRTVGFASGEAR